jgi:hypothetical protein
MNDAFGFAADADPDGPVESDDRGGSGDTSVADGEPS